MSRRQSPRLVLVATCTLVLAAAAAGVTYAATSPTTNGVVYACANSRGTLKLLVKAKCPSGYQKVSIDKQGPTGPSGVQGAQGIQGIQGSAGPGLVVAEVESSSGPAFEDTPVPGTGLTLHAVCQPDANGASGLYLFDADGSASYVVNGSDNLVTTGGGRAFLVNNGAPGPNLATGMTPIGYTQPASVGTNSEFVAQLSGGGSAELTVDASVTRSGRTFVIHVHVLETAAHCLAQGWATPAT